MDKVEKWRMMVREIIGLYEDGQLTLQVAEAKISFLNRLIQRATQKEFEARLNRAA